MDKCFHIMQGDSYPIEFAFYDEETGKKITNSEVSKIEFILGDTVPRVGEPAEKQFIYSSQKQSSNTHSKGGTGK